MLRIVVKKHDKKPSVCRGIRTPWAEIGVSLLISLNHIILASHSKGKRVVDYFKSFFSHTMTHKILKPMNDNDLDELFSDDYSSSEEPSQSEIIDIQKELDRRRPGGGAAGSTLRKESDRVEILSGVFEGKSTGTPISSA